MMKQQFSTIAQSKRQSIIVSIVIVGLWLSVLASGLAVVYATHLSRQLFAELDGLNRENSELHVEWGQYLLEQSTWSAFDRVETIAANQLNMHLPAQEHMVIVESE